MFSHVIKAAIVISVGLSHSALAEFRGNVALELRGYTEKSDNQNSISFSPEWYWQSSAAVDTLSLELFVRYDDLDDDRSHGDIRDLYWTHVTESHEFHVGVRRIFWGVAESVHLVDVINQTDLVESVDGEDKLGQPMLQMSTVRDWGVVDFFLMPYFRERTFASPEGRLSGPLNIADDAAFESVAEEWHQDFALRYSNTFDRWDVGLSYFQGTNREPKLRFVPGDNYLQPYYDQSKQISADIQATVDEWLWKLEYLVKDDSIGLYSAAVLGFEYTLFNVKESGADLGLLMEYQFDDRAPAFVSLSQNDVFVGMRITLNDVQDSQFLAGVIQDLDGAEQLYFMEANRRLGDAWRISADVRIFADFPDASPVAYLNQQDHVTFTLEYYF